MIVDAIRAALDAAVCDDAGEVLPPGTLAVTEREADEQGALRGAALAQLAETFDGLAEQYEGSEQRILNSDGDVAWAKWSDIEHSNGERMRNAAAEARRLAGSPLPRVVRAERFSSCCPSIDGVDMRSIAPKKPHDDGGKVPPEGILLLPPRDDR
ncbi:MAG: hypothetical protein KC503_17515 [Myxococcales bacterium]|nr:hypothetical protein [Myxococcales bacterium]